MLIHFRHIVENPHKDTRHIVDYQGNSKIEYVEHYMHDYNKKTIIFYENGKCTNNSIDIEYYPNGNVRSYSCLINNKLCGPEIEYNKFNCMTKSKFHNECVKISCHKNANGQYHGRCIYYNELGNILQTCEYDNGVKHGTCKKYYPNGTIFSKCEYIYGERHGEYITYHYYHYKVACIHTYVYGILHGIAKYYNQKDKLIAMELYENDEYVEEIIVEN